MRRLSALASFWLLAWPLSAAEIEVRQTGPQLPVVKPVETALVPGQGGLTPIPALLELAQAPEILSAAQAAVPQNQAPLAARLGVKDGAPIAAALAPVSQDLAAPGAGKSEADADWNARTGERPLNIVLAAAEAVPLIKTGGLADVIDAIGRGFAARGHNVTLFLPKHAQIKTAGLFFKKLDQTVTVPVAGRAETGTLLEAYSGGMRVVLIEHDGFFKRDAPYGGYYGDFPDSDERFIFFSRAVLEASKTLGLKPDVIHAHDWHAALVAPMLKLLYGGDKVLAQAKAVITLHNMAFQGNFGPEVLEKAGFSQGHFTADALEHKGRFNFLKGGLQYADALTTVSPTYAKEIQNDPKFGMGLETVLKSRAKDLHGIVNGVDYELWDPATNELIGRNYGAGDVRAGKAAAKKALQANTGLTIDPNAPLFGVAARLSHQKGLDLVAEIAPKLVELGGQLVLVGTGDKALEDKFKDLAARYPKSVFVRPVFDELFPHRIFAASDFLFMPSRFEPCGLSQLMAQRYGSLPIATKTGGLADTITDVRADPKNGDGLFVSEFSPAALTETVVAAIAHFNDGQALARSRRAAMTKDVSWDASVERYLSLFKSLKDEPAPAPSKKGSWLKDLRAALDARSTAEKVFWYSLWASLAVAAVGPALYGVTALIYSLIALVAGGALPALGLFGVTAGRLAGLLRGKRAPAVRPKGRWLRAAALGLALGIGLGAGPLMFRPQIIETGARVVAPAQEVRRVHGTLMQDEIVRLMAANPIGSKVLNELRDKGGRLHLPDFYVSKQSDSVAAHTALFDGMLVDAANVTAHGWTVEDFVRDPAKQKALVAEMETTLVHELTHAAQARRMPASPREAIDGIRLHLNVESEQEAFLNEHLYIYERLKADPAAELGTEAFGGFLAPIDDINGFLNGIGGMYPNDKSIDTAYFHAYFAKVRVGWPAHAVDCYVLLAKRAQLQNKSPKIVEMYLKKAAAIAEKNDLPAPVLSVQVAGAPSASPAGK